MTFSNLNVVILSRYLKNCSIHNSKILVHQQLGLSFPKIVNLVDLLFRPVLSEFPTKFIPKTVQIIATK